MEVENKKGKPPHGNAYIAEKMYMESSLTKIEIATHLKVSIGTVNKWSYQYNWKERKDANEKSRAQIITKTLEQIQFLQTDIANRNAVPTSNEAAVIKTLVSVVEKMEAYTKVNQSKQVFKNLIAFLSKSDVELATILKQKEVDFIKHIALNK